jgi:hypothetical protein
MMRHAGQPLLDRFTSGFRHSRHDETMTRMTAMQLLDQRGRCHHFAERNRMDPNCRSIRRLRDIGQPPPKPLGQPSATTFFGEQDDENDGRGDQQQNIIKEMPHDFAREA